MNAPGVGQLVATQQAVVDNLQVALGRPLPQGSLQGMPPISALYALGLFSGVMAGFTLNGLFAFGEEYGWRGVLWMSGGSGTPLGFKGPRIPGVFMMCVWLIPFASCSALRARLLAPAVIHGIQRIGRSSSC